jgi:hypothetical protein
MQMEFIPFLLKAKHQTYASGGEGNAPTLEDGAHEMSYREGEYVYRDRYFGFNPFIGEEVVWRDNKVVWAMNYYGMVTDESVAADDIYHFLQKALQQVSAERPFRGPHEFREGDYLYQDTSEGDVAQFSGEETIFYKNTQVYLLTYHGGKVE